MASTRSSLVFLLALTGCDRCNDIDIGSENQGKVEISMVEAQYVYNIPPAPAPKVATAYVVPAPVPVVIRVPSKVCVEAPCP